MSMIGGENQNGMNPMPGLHWDGNDGRSIPSNGSGDWFQYKYFFFEKLNSLDKKVDDIEKVVEEIKVSFIKLQTKIMVVSALSGVISAALITAVFTSLADKFIK